MKKQFFLFTCLFITFSFSWLVRAENLSTEIKVVPTEELVKQALYQTNRKLSFFETNKTYEINVAYVAPYDRTLVDTSGYRVGLNHPFFWGNLEESFTYYQMTSDLSSLKSLTSCNNDGYCSSFKQKTLPERWALSVLWEPTFLAGFVNHRLSSYFGDLQLSLSPLLGFQFSRPLIDSKSTDDLIVDWIDELQFGAELGVRWRIYSSYGWGLITTFNIVNPMRRFEVEFTSFHMGIGYRL